MQRQPASSSLIRQLHRLAAGGGNEAVSIAVTYNACAEMRSSSQFVVAEVYMLPTQSTPCLLG